MATTDFNWLDKLIAKLRLGKIIGWIDKDDIVLDFGCGSQGLFLNQVVARIKSGVGLDVGIEEWVAGKLKFVNCKFEDKLPLESKFFDKVVMLAVLEHLEPKTAKLLFGELKRILKPEGKVILTTPTPLGKPVMEVLAFFKIISVKEIRDHKKYYDKKSLLELATKTGFKINNYRLFQLGLNSVAVLEKN